MANVHEIWLPIVGYEGYYEVSNLGSVRSIDRYIRGRGESIKPIFGSIKSVTVSNKGYLFCALYKHCKPKNFLIHRLVACAFIPNPENKPCINHIDCDRSNNNVANLEWVTYKENTSHRANLNRTAKGEKQGSSKLNEDAIRYIRNNYIKGKNSLELATMFGVCRSNIVQVANGTWWKHVL